MSVNKKDFIRLCIEISNNNFQIPFDSWTSILYINVTQNYIAFRFLSALPSQINLLIMTMLIKLYPLVLEISDAIITAQVSVMHTNKLTCVKQMHPHL